MWKDKPPMRLEGRGSCQYRDEVCLGDASGGEKQFAQSWYRGRMTILKCFGSTFNEWREIRGEHIRLWNHGLQMLNDVLETDTAFL